MCVIAMLFRLELYISLQNPSRISHRIGIRFEYLLLSNRFLAEIILKFD